MIKVVICDGDGSIALDRPSDARTIVEGLDELGIELAVASNRSKSRVVGKFRSAGLTPPRVIVTRNDVGSPKPSPELVFEIADQTGAELNEIAFLGDDDNTDSLCAINARVLPLLAMYSSANKPREYGLAISDPEYLLRYLRLYCLQEPPYFGWEYSGHCQDTYTDIDIRALLGQHSWTPAIERLLKHRDDCELGPRNISLWAVLFHYLVSCIYLSGLVNDMDFVCVYPGHEQGTYNPLLAGYSESIKSIFRTRVGSRYVDSLLCRHTTAPKSQFQGSQRSIHDQFRTINVDPDYIDRLQGNHVVVLDDFTTKGYSLETARRMLLSAGASQVTCIAIGKWGASQAVSRVSDNWDAFAPCGLGANDIRVDDLTGRFYDDADNHFRHNVWEFLQHN